MNPLPARRFCKYTRHPLKASPGHAPTPGRNRFFGSPATHSHPPRETPKQPVERKRTSEPPPRRACLSGPPPRGRNSACRQSGLSRVLVQAGLASGRCIVPASSFSVPSSVFAGLSALPGPVAVVGSRQLPPAALQSVARLGRWVGRNHRPLWSGGALGTDSAASAGALCQGGSVRWWLPATCSALPAGSPQPSVRGPSGTFPLSAPRTLARSASCLPFAGGPATVPYHVRLFQRTRILLLSLHGKPQPAIVAFLAQQAFVSRKGGTWFTIRQAPVGRQQIFLLVAS
jgi:hypothetical protein